jgi:predicted RecA/RadA family phage recombinase
MAEALRRGDTGVVSFTAATTYSEGEVIQLADKRAGVIDAGAIGSKASGDLVDAYTQGQFDVAKADGVVFADGDPVYWDYSGNTALVAPGAAEDFLLGPAVGAAASAVLWVRVDLNVASGRTWTRRIKDADMVNVPGFEGEVVYNDEDNKVYKCTATSGTNATWVELDEP